LSIPKGLMHSSDIWTAPYAERPVNGTVRVPGSKSLTNRYLVLAALATSRNVVRHPLISRDTTLMRAALEQLGVRFTASDDNSKWLIDPPAHLCSGLAIDAGLAGTVMRFVPPLAALTRGEITFDGDEAARTRPMGPLVHALRDLGIRVDSESHTEPDTKTEPTLPLTVHGTGSVDQHEAFIDASASSQFVSALLLAGARFTHGLTLRHTGQGLPSRPHIEMTLHTLAQVGVTASEIEPAVWRVEPGPIAGFDVSVEPDLSSAAPFLALAAVSGGTITVPSWPTSTTQAGDAMRGVLTQMGADITHTPGGLQITGPPPGSLRGIDIDLHDVGELTPVIAAVAATASSPSRLRGVSHLRGHETDRLAALEAELSRMGAHVRQHDDGLSIEPAALHGAELQTYGDHRMAMAAAVLGASVPGVSVVDVATTAKTYPGFANVWTALVA